MTDPLSEPAKGTPYWLRPERDPEIEARHLKLLDDMYKLKQLEKESYKCQ